MAGIEFVPDEHGGVTVMRDGHPQSHVDVADPEHLVFEYVQHMAAAIDATFPGPDPIGVTHVGGAGLTLPRWVQATRPGSPQIVLEPDERLTAAVREELPLPRGHRIRVRPQLGRAGVAALKDASAHVVLVDAFDEGRVPADLQTVEFFAEVARVLRPDGFLAMNCPDEPGWRHVKDVVAGLLAVFGTFRGLTADGLRTSTNGEGVALVAMRDVMKGRRYGNTLLLASHRPIDADELRRQVGRWPFPSGVLAGAALTRRTNGGTPITDGDSRPSPVAPDPGTWRAR
ncbi:fused MFS/spermidine synthase [Janibacter sp. DB-40]|uniref:spermidine synthase n=1 Tax=Janibacter sp. DB-40 TaxID=3028808 RepID=UPI0024057B95|nr:fused MFS/spermidine synthase [Janibacter sp. DB-40]